MFHCGNVSDAFLLYSRGQIGILQRQNLRGQMRRIFRTGFAHRNGTVPFACTDCHSVHSDTRQGRLAILGNGGACIECHTEEHMEWLGSDHHLAMQKADEKELSQ